MALKIAVMPIRSRDKNLNLNTGPLRSCSSGMRHFIDLVETNQQPKSSQRPDFKLLKDAFHSAQAEFVANRSPTTRAALRKASKDLDDFILCHQSKPPPPLPPKTESYHGEHRAPMHNTGSPLFDLTLNGHYQPDAYIQKMSYLFSPDERSVLGLVWQARDKPDMPVMIYRAVPSDIIPQISVGDWVTVSRKYAVDHAKEYLTDGYQITEKKVRAADIFTNGDSLLEWGYDPQA